MYITIKYRQAFKASIVRPLHQVYEKMLDCINQNVYLPKVVPLKWGCKEFGVYGCLGCAGSFEGGERVVRGRKAPPHEIILNN